ncbi:unnamed protein product [Paramecium pentaurelia]|uniref:Uncharacterized protein n=1 Tax=Paramecium pentaurelia TaxID=43138 RepID=A0A8S1XVQ7_9CILI|nr:unnamed protein product [Paramecium pentaurelia]
MSQKRKFHRDYGLDLIVCMRVILTKQSVEIIRIKNTSLIGWIIIFSIDISEFNMNGTQVFNCT